MPGATPLKDGLIIYLKGVCMGAADTIPGVSGGTIALIVGIYDRLVTAIAALHPRPLRRLPRLHHPDERARLLADLARMDLGFLVVLGLGILTAIIGLSGFIAYALRNHPVPTNAFFFGLIAASAVVLYSEVRLDSPKRLIAAAAAILLAFYVTGFTATGALPHANSIVFVAGVLASSAMILPGISGAAFLYLLGQYEYLVGVLFAFLGALVTGNFAGLTDPGMVVGVFGLGFVVGILSIAHAVRWALRVDRATTLTVLVSLMVGALRFPGEAVRAAAPAWTTTTILVVLAAAGTGVVLVLALDRYTDALEYV